MAVTMRSALGLGSALLVAAATLAWAPSARASDGVFTVGVGVMGGGGVVGLGKPGDTSVGPNTVDTSYPGFFGGSYGGGIMVDARAIRIIGLEVDFLRTSDFGNGDYNLAGNPFVIKIGQSAWQMPVLLKAVLPFGVFRPFIGFGPTFVFPGDATATVTSSGSATLQTKVEATASSYTLLTGVLGGEVHLPIPAVDLRIPISLRYGYNTGTSDKITDRRDATTSGNAITGVKYKSEWQHHGSANVGVAIYF